MFFISAPLSAIDLGLGSLFAPKVPFVIPAKYPGASQIRSLVITAADNKAQGFLPALESALIGLRVDDRPFYGRIATERVTGTSTDSALVTLGTRENVAGVLSLSVTGLDFTQATSQEQRSRCTAANSGFICPKKNQQSYNVSCNERTAQLTLGLRVFDVQNNKLVVSDLIGGKATGKMCSGDEQPMPPDSALAGSALDAVLKGIVADLAPRVEPRPLELMDPDDKVPAPSKEAMKAALKFAKAKRMDEACSRLDSLYDDNKDSIALSYDKGFCDESRGDTFKADGEYRQASHLANAPNGLIDRHLTEVDRQLKAGVLTPVPIAPSGPGSTGEKPSADELARQRRVALVIGNAHYAVHSLRNPLNDANSVAKTLTKLGFHVTLLVDATSGRFAHVIDQFVLDARGADAALLYFSGHGFQASGENWLMPVDNESVSCLEDAVDDKNRSGQVWAQQVSILLARLEGATDGAKILVLDACRDSPLPACSKSSTRGLATMTPPRGSVVAFATRPGMTAAEGRGSVSLFTRNFTKTIETPDLSLEDVLKQVREAVETESASYGKKQTPSEVGELTGNFYFKVSR